MLAATCENVHGGTFLGEGSVCELSQGCCRKDEFGMVSCSDIDPRCCAHQGGLPMGSGTSCLGDSDDNGIDDLCEPSIPTVSQWGLVVLTLLLMTMWKIYFGRRTALSA